MIIPMRKYSFLVHHTDYPEFLRELRQLGVFHVRERTSEDPDEEISRSLQWRRQITETISALKRRGNTAGPVAEIPASATAIVQMAREMQEDVDRCRQQIQSLDKEIAALGPWGDFSPAVLAGLEEAGVKVHFYISPLKSFTPAWQESYPLEIIQTLANEVYFVVFSDTETAPDIDAEEIRVPEKPASELNGEREGLTTRIREMETALDALAAGGLPLLEKNLLLTEEETELARVLVNTEKGAEEKLMILEGFVPRPREKELIGFCENHRVVYLAEHPKAEDGPPVLLKNNRFSRLFEPIGELFSLPGYAELDLTPFFAPFFMMFFGFCLGDVGYGLVILVAAGLYKGRAEARLRPALTLAQFLGGATIIFGALTGTVFGVNLLGDEYAWLGRARDFMLNSDQVFELALILGLVQILFGLVLQAVNRTIQLGFRYSISVYGWLILLISIADLAYLKMTGPLSAYAAWTGVGLILLFNDPDAGFLVRIGKGLWELYGITGFFGDLLSYIRLFALGSSSAILGFVVNDIALQLKDSMPVLGPVLFILLLVIGHGANLLISVLGSFVHPMRLTFVEFYKNAGFAGGGKPYKPFATKIHAAPDSNGKSATAPKPESKQDSQLSKV